jgi:DNA-directed RNA polymerase, mitochondrial
MTSNRDDDDQRDHRDRSKPQRNAAPLLSRPDDVRRSASVPASIEQYLPKELPSDPRERAQLLREFGTRADGYQKTKRGWNKAQRRGDARQSKAASKLARFWTEPLAAKIESEAATLIRRRGKKDNWHSAYRLLGAKTLAQETAFAILSLLINRKPEERDEKIVSQAVARAIGRQISIAYRLKVWRKLNPALFVAYDRGLDKAAATPPHREEVMLHGLNNRARDPELATPEFIERTEPWTVNKSALIGAWLLWMSVDVAKGAIQLSQSFNKNGSIRDGYYYVSLAPKAVEWLEEAVERQALRATDNRAMICPPRPWHGAIDGGYLLGDDLSFSPTSMIRGREPVRESVEEALEHSDARIAAASVFRSLNVLQETPYAINAAVHDIAREAATANLQLDDLPASYVQERAPKAPPTGDSEADRALLSTWKRKQAEVENSNARNISKALWSRSVLSEAAELRDLDVDGEIRNGPLWFVHRLDSRSRIVPAGSAINPHGADLARSLLRFQQGKPIGADRGPFWLAVQVAKAFGRDKLSWADRERWVHDNEDMIRRIAAEPLTHRRLWKSESDKLWAALAAAREWTAYRNGGSRADFITTLPIFIDGTCNGLQHFGALSRDIDLARSVNLESGELPADIYREVAAEALNDIKMRSEHGATSDRRAALLWLRIIGDEPPRRLAKKITMTKPYGSSFNVILKEVREFFDDNESKRQAEWGRSVDDREAADLRGWLAKRMEAALKGSTDPADRIMVWLQDAMELLCDHEAADKLKWCTPAGFPWRGNLYYGHTKKKPKFTVDGKQHAMTLASNDTSKFKRKKAVSAIAANFVQSLDAASMMFAVNEANARGVTDMMAIHDCIGGLAPDMDITADAVRVGFVRCHEAMPLESFREAVLMALPNAEARAKLRPLPERGEFDVRRVLGSGYFFC